MVLSRFGAIRHICRGKKMVVLGTDEVDLTPPRDRNGSYDPQLIPKGQKYFAEFDHNIITMYGRGMSVRDTQACLLDMYDVESRFPRA